MDKDRATANFLQFKHLARSYKNVLNFSTFIRILVNDYSEQFTEFVKLGKVAIVIPVSSAPCERGFSVQNSIKNKVRNKLNPTRLNRLMFIKLVGPDIESFDFNQAARMFANMKNRH